MFPRIIVDESQCLDDSRGELILKFFSLLGCDSLSLFGDPRQKIRSGCGGWYRELCEHGKSSFCDLNEVTIHRTAFTYTFRFRNPKLIELANSISSRRPKYSLTDDVFSSFCGIISSC